MNWKPINIFGGSGTGRGPVYPGLGRAAGRLATDPDPSGWFRGKVFWYVKPSYKGRVLIRGRRLDAHGALRLDHPRGTELRIPIHNGIDWSGRPPGARGEASDLFVHRGGCYGVQMDGTNFSRVVVFSISSP